MNFGELERYVLEEIESYRYEVPEGTLGRQLPNEKVEQLLGEMREALVPPEWRVVEQRDAHEDAQNEPARRCILVADDREGYQLFFDPAQGDFVLAHGDPPRTMGIRGDAVGCFMAR
jgi:hypothetical protein